MAPDWRQASSTLLFVPSCLNASIPSDYNPAMSIVRDLIYGLALAVTSPIWGISLLRSGKWRSDWRGRFGHMPADLQVPAQGVKTIMIHAVSLGEVNATRELVKRLHEQLAGKARIVITTTTNTGHARALELYAKHHAVLRYPLDFTRSVRRFLDAVKPDVVALIELEVWPTFVSECARRGIPVCVINGRLSERSFKRYRIIRRFMRKSFASLAVCAAQTADYAKRFIGMGAIEERVHVTDSMKWDTSRVMDASEVAGVDELALAMGISRGKPVIVAGSTGPGEEEMLIRTKPAGVQLVLVPRKPERFEEVAQVIKRASPHAVVTRRSQQPDGTPAAAEGAEVFLLDTMGELRKAYALADVVIVGRSFIDLFGSDPIEPIALGKPTVIGPRYGDFTDIVETFADEGGIVISGNPCEAASELLADAERARALAVNGRRVILSRQGATDRHAAIVIDLLNRRTTPLE